MISKRILAISAVAALALTGCAGGTGAGSSGGDKPAEGGATTIKLVAAEYSKDNTKAFWDQFAKAYNEKTGNTLEVQVVSWDNIDQTSSTMIQNNQAPDILNLNAFARTQRRPALGRRRLLRTGQGRHSRTFVTYGTYDGTFYGFPDLSAHRLRYNKDLFEKAGIAEPRRPGPIRDAARRSALGDGVVGYAMPLGLRPGRVRDLDLQQRRRLEGRRRLDHQLRRTSRPSPSQKLNDAGS